MPRYRVIVSYDGTDYFGWQRQPDRRSVQQDLEEAILPLSPNGELVQVHGSGRTDAGVHAVGQVAHFDLARKMDCIALRRAINTRLQHDARVISAEEVSDDFDARRSAVAKQYRYKIWNAEIMDPMLRRFRLHVSRHLDIDAMREAASFLVGEHDFAAFTANPQREVESTVRNVFALEVLKNGTEVEIRATGNGFLYKMVRSLSGFLVSVGQGKEKPATTASILASRTRTARVESAPPQGLFLWRVWYDPEEFSRDISLDQH